MLSIVLFSALALLVSCIFMKLRYMRLQQYAHFPQLPPSSIWGHLQIINEYIKRAPQKAHPGLAFAAMHESLGRPPAMLVDLRPVASPMLVVGSYKLAEQITKISNQFPHSPPKAPEIWDHMVHLTGPRAIISSSGEEWKALRKRFNPGFATQHLLTQLPPIVDMTKIFTDRLECFVQNQEEFSLQDLATSFSFDVIATLVLDVDMCAQSKNPAKFVRVFHELIETYTSEQIDLPWWCTPRLEWTRKRLAKQLKDILRDIVREKFAETQQGTSICSRSILFMSLQNLDSLSDSAIDVTCDQLTTFIFAGHDTAGSVIACAFYELSRAPHVLRAVRAELDELFGPDCSPEYVAARLSAKGAGEVIHKMPYTSAVLKETLRLWPPAATARISQPGDGLQLVMESEGRARSFNVDGIMLHPLQQAMHRDPAVFGGNADAFVPERWLGLGAEKIPAGAWRPFERGPRNCIGQELAMIEARIVIAMIARRFDFVKVGIGAFALDSATGDPIIGEHGQYKVMEELYQTRQVTAKPIDGMIMRVKHAT